MAVVAISNRSQKKELRDGTLNALELQGVEIATDDVLCMVETSDKTKRRADVQKKFTVLLYIGDNLRDLYEGTISVRQSTTRSARCGRKTGRNARGNRETAFAVDRCLICSAASGSSCRTRLRRMGESPRPGERIKTC